MIKRDITTELLEENLKPARFFNSYLQTYVERDIRALINLKDLTTFQQFIRLLARRIGQIVNYASLSNDVDLIIRNGRKLIPVEI